MKQNNPSSLFPQVLNPSLPYHFLHYNNDNGDTSHAARREGVVVGKPQTPIACGFQVVSFGYDTFHISLDLQGFTPSDFEEMTKAKHSLQSGNDQEVPFKFLKNGSSKFSWNISRTGINFYPYVFRSGDLTFGLSSRAPGSKIPNACLLIGSISCHSDIAKLFLDFKWWFGNVGVSVISDSVSRADICADIQCDIEKQRLDKVSRFITYARDHAIRGSNHKFTSITWGSGQIMCRIYNKQLEMKQTNSIEKQMFFCDKWGLSKDTPVTRVEFQLRRQAIKEFFQFLDAPAGEGLGPLFYVSGPCLRQTDKGSFSLEIFLARASDLWRYLTEDWLRHCDRVVDREHKNQSRAKNSRFWATVQSASWLIGPELPMYRKRKPKFIDIVALRKQLTGCMVSVLAGIDGLCTKSVDYFDVISTATQILAHDLCEKMAEPGFSRKFEGILNRASLSFGPISDNRQYGCPVWSMNLVR